MPPTSRCSSLPTLMILPCLYDIGDNHGRREFPLWSDSSVLLWGSCDLPDIQCRNKYTCICSTLDPFNIHSIKTFKIPNGSNHSVCSTSSNSLGQQTSSVWSGQGGGLARGNGCTAPPNLQSRRFWLSSCSRICSWCWLFTSHAIGNSILASP